MSQKKDWEFLYEWEKEIREEKYEKYKKTIDLKEFINNAELNKTLILDLNKVCKHGLSYEVEKVVTVKYI